LAALAAASAHAQPVAFDWFEYSGKDAIYSAPLPAGSFHNPILAGYYPDPSITRAGDKYYLVNSTFAHFPGIPIHESDDLVNWRLIGHALSDPSKISFDGLNISRGVFAPSIHFHDGTYYIINTLVDAGGNFFVTAKNPAGPWSDPVWLKGLDGIDPSIFFDDDGKAYVLNNGGPEGKPLYDGHRAIWIQEFDVAAGKLVGPRKVIVNGGVDLSKKPIWIEGPHLYRVNDWYYLSCAEGGTGPGHSQVVLRARSPWGPYEPYAGNPILTQRDLPADRPDPITNAGHADFVQTQDGSWWAVFLASRPYVGDRYNTGRETFLLPVSWKDGWPVILEAGKPIPTTLPGPKNIGKSAGDALSGNFTRRDEFDGAKPGPEWLQVHVPKQTWMNLRDGRLEIHPQLTRLDETRNPSFLARRQQHLTFEATTRLQPPSSGTVSAGLAAYQNETHWYFLHVRRMPDGLRVSLERRAGKDLEIVVSEALPAAPWIKLRISAERDRYSFLYSIENDATGDDWRPLRANDDGSLLSTEVAGGFVGTVLGPYARQE
jgi:alpha-N-arabinofuranosidase